MIKIKPNQSTPGILRIIQCKAAIVKSILAKINQIPIAIKKVVTGIKQETLAIKDTRLLPTLSGIKSTVGIKSTK